MMRWICLILLMMTLSGCGHTKVVREARPYAQEMMFMQATGLRLAEHTVSFIQVACVCDAGDWAGPNAEICRQAAKDALTAKDRLPKHTAWAFYNAGLTQEEPSREIVPVPPSIVLCPAEVDANEMAEGEGQ